MLSQRQLVCSTHNAPHPLAAPTGAPEMTMTISRRGVLTGLLAAPLIVAVGKVMPIKTPKWDATCYALMSGKNESLWVKRADNGLWEPMPHPPFDLGPYCTP